MSDSVPSEQELLKTILEPLLEDFHYWFARTRTLLESEQMSFLSQEEQKTLLARIVDTQQEVNTAKILFKAVNEQVGVETMTLMSWHKLVAECWQVSRRWRALQINPEL